ncbi:MAG TPA: MarR family transcriptional regulator [Micropruina sp.]|jgi:DNA-binding MarR family transcriptional regulator|nr:MarR family transcriptional regulator [Micropruina sp.]
MSELTDRLNMAIRTVGFASRYAADEWVRSSGLTRQQAFTLGYIEEHQHRGVIARELAEMNGTTPASVASLLQGLEERGYLVRTPSPKDSRVKLLSITPQAAGLIDGFDDAMRASQERLFSPLNHDEQVQLLALLERLTAEVPDAPSPPDRRRNSPT